MFCKSVFWHPRRKTRHSHIPAHEVRSFKVWVYQEPSLGVFPSQLHQENKYAADRLFLGAIYLLPATVGDCSMGNFDSIILRLELLDYSSKPS